jgi:endonuclease/exonuclease/phosphatase family metal-dependent hydrolase
VGSFNTRYLGGNTEKDIQAIAKIIKGENFSVVALQEVTSEDGLIELRNALGASWEYVVSPKVGREHYELG